MRRLVVMLLVMVMVVPLLLVAPDTVAADSGSSWIGEYFTNPNIAGSPILVRMDDTVSFDWGAGSPFPALIPVDGFSVRWTGVQNFTGGLTTFLATVDDGVRVWVDDVLVIDAWYNQMSTTHTNQVQLTPGQHYVRIEYYDALDQASIYVRWLPQNVQNAPGWEAAYFNNTTLQEPQVAGRLEPIIDHNWGAGSPFPGVVNENNFSARWRGYPVLEGGTYTFVAGADDGIRVWVDNILVIDAWAATPYNEVRNSIALEGGQHTITVEYYEAGAHAQVSLYWIYDGPGAAGAQAAQSDVTATVIAYKLNVRGGPSVSFGIITKVLQGESYPVIGVSEDGGWYQILGPDWEGWVSGAYVNVTEGDVPVTGAVTVYDGLQARSLGSVRIRRGPGTDQSRIAAFNSGETADVIGRNAAGDWVAIRKADGTEGWVYNGSYVTLEGSTPLMSIPVTG